MLQFSMPVFVSNSTAVEEEVKCLQYLQAKCYLSFVVVVIKLACLLLYT